MKSPFVALIVLFTVSTMLLTGCGSVRSRGGTTQTSTPTLTTRANQPESPKDATTQDVNSETEDSYTVPQGSTITAEEPVIVNDPKSGKPVVAGYKKTSTTPSAPMPVVKKRKDGATTKVGAAQKDDLATTIATIRSYRWLQVIGVVVFLLGCASFHPYAQAILNSKTTSALIAIAGLGLIFIPPFVVEHPILVFTVGIGVPAAYWWIHRHGGLSAELSAAKSYLVKLETGFVSPAAATAKPAATTVTVSTAAPVAQPPTGPTVVG